MLLIRTMTRWCNTVLVAGITVAAGLSTLAVWTETGEAVLWQGISSIAIVMAASFSTLLVTNAF
ncbi:MAG: hypothetical protein AAGK04_02435 [Planctomycetota bacterium]